MTVIDELNKINKQSWLLIQGIVIIITLVTLLVYTYNDLQTQKEMKENCGWMPSDKVSCVCTKTDWNQFTNKLKLNETEIFNGTEIWNT